MLYTSLNAREDVPKSHPRIELRGRLDSLNAQIIFLQTLSKNDEYISDLEEIREAVRMLQRCEAMNDCFADELILRGIDDEEIHYRSHATKKFYGRGHILPHMDMKQEAAGLNLLRTLVREAELCACRAFSNEDPLRIIHVLNRLSSALYIMMYEYIPEDYSHELKFTRA